MMKHYSEADLLETYYMQPGESMPVMMHLAECPDCAARYERLETKLREAATCHTSADDRPDTFWARQRHSIMRSIGAHRERSATAARTTRAAAAALLAFFLGGAVVYQSVKPHSPSQGPVTLTAKNTPPPAPSPADEPVAHDPWQTDELRDFHAVVAWETWVDPQPDRGSKALGGKSL
jgi:hypothetical protein